MGCNIQHHGLGELSQARDRKSVAGKAERGSDRTGATRQVWRGLEMIGMAGTGRLGGDWTGAEGLGMEERGRRGLAGRGADRRCPERRGRHG